MSSFKNREDDTDSMMVGPHTGNNFQLEYEYFEDPADPADDAYHIPLRGNDEVSSHPMELSSFPPDADDPENVAHQTKAGRSWQGVRGNPGRGFLERPDGPFEDGQHDQNYDDGRVDNDADVVLIKEGYEESGYEYDGGEYYHEDSGHDEGSGQDTLITPDDNNRTMPPGPQTHGLLMEKSQFDLCRSLRAVCRQVCPDGLAIVVCRNLLYHKSGCTCGAPEGPWDYVLE